jgi:hypothetical protein
VLLKGDAAVGRARQADPQRANVWLATVSYHVDTTGFEFPQFLNVVFGNSSIKEGLVVEEILPCASLAKGERPAGCRAIVGQHLDLHLPCSPHEAKRALVETEGFAGRRVLALIQASIYRLR